MNFSLSKEIYGQPWCIDQHSMQYLSAILRNAQNNVTMETPEVRLNSLERLEITSETRLINRSWQLRTDSNFTGIGVINLNGPITKTGGSSSYGMVDLASEMVAMSRDSRVKGFIIKTDSGGGATSAVKIMVDAINEVKQTKPVYALIDKGGLAGSAAYGIISAATRIYAEDPMSVVGSVGTMIQFEGREANSTDTEGVKHIRLYASKSTAKNKAFEEALNNDNYALVINELLDPINENFLNTVLSNRPVLAGTAFDTANTVFAKDAEGTFIDGFLSFDEVVALITQDSLILNNNPNSNQMTKSQIQQEHPSVYAEIVSEGVRIEKERVASWMAHSGTDPDAVNAGIASGLEITPSQTQNFLVKMTSNSMKANLQADNAPAVKTEQSQVAPTEAKEEDTELENAFKFNL